MACPHAWGARFIDRLGHNLKDIFPEMRNLPVALAQSLPCIAEIAAEPAGKVAALHATKTPENLD